MIIELTQKEAITKEKAREGSDSFIEDRDWRGRVLEVVAEEHFPRD